MTTSEGTDTLEPGSWGGGVFEGVFEGVFGKGGLGRGV